MILDNFQWFFRVPNFWWSIDIWGLLRYLFFLFLKLSQNNDSTDSGSRCTGDRLRVCTIKNVGEDGDNREKGNL
jgi:hypothetical protein